MRYLLVLLLVFWAAFAGVANADIDNKGTEFFIAFVPNHIPPTIQLHLTASAPTDVTISYPMDLTTQMLAFSKAGASLK